MNTEPRERALGLDLIRLISFLAIGTHHVSWVYFYSVDIPTTPHSFIIQLFEFQARSLAFSGFTILFMTMALTALSGRDTKRKKEFLVYLLAAWVLFTMFIEWESVIVLPWDIYPLILVGLLILHGLETLGRNWVRAAGLIGFVLLWIPFWNFEWLQALPLWLRQAIIGDCGSDMAEWAILPWIGLVWLGYAVGSEMKARHISAPSEKCRLHWREAAVWLVLLAASIPQWGEYFRTPMGNEFSCYVYRRAPLVFWSHLVWAVFLMRASFDDRVQNRLKQNAFARWVSTLLISRKFWLAYLVHYPLAYAIALLGNEFARPTAYHNEAVAFVAIIYMPATEMVCRAIVRTWDRMRGKALSA